MKVLILHKDKLSSKREKEIETARTFLEKYTPLKWHFEYRRDRDLQDKLVIEDGDNLDEHAIKRMVNESEFDFIHLDLTDALWSNLKLRKTLYGQAEFIDGQGITYGRWTQRNKSYVRKLPVHLRFLSEVGLGIVHEIAHCLGRKHKIPYTTHSWFYGYNKLYSRTEEKEVKPRRFAKTPTPDKFYEELPWKPEAVDDTIDTELLFKGNPAVTTIVLHHTAVSRSAQSLQFENVNNFHRNKDWGGGWKQTSPSELGYYVGYNFFTEPTGARYQARLIGEETLAQTGMNCDTPERCTAISYCMAGDFRVEKPTQQQVNDFRDFIQEVKKIYPNVFIKQHKDVQAGRTCAELTALELENIATIPSTDDKDAQIAALRAQVKQLIAMVTVLIKLLTK